MRSEKVLYCIWRGQKGLEINNTVRVSGMGLLTLQVFILSPP